ncbi:MAG: ribose 5-phosphate isomerase B [Candidatus Omnitrophica bacterium]|nr:ribose 5-phosphate isomerase B [Candidatus Omnitrophota bacterium]
MRPKLVIAADHRGVALKSEILRFLRSKGYSVEDLGTNSEDSVDYPDYAIQAAQRVQEGKADLGIVICHSGIGVSVSANKVKGIRAALCQTVEQAELSKKHTNANILALPAGFVKGELAQEIVSKWLATGFEGGHHEKRIHKIQNFEERKRDREN